MTELTSKGQAMRRRLIDAAIDRFAANGFSVTGVGEITRAAGTSHGNFYRYFTNVEDVLRAAVDEPLEQLSLASEPPTGDDATSIEALQRWHERFLFAYVPHRTLFTVMREAAAADRGDGFAATWRQLRASFVATIERWIGEVEDRLGPDPAGLSADELAEALGSMAEQIAHVRLGLADRPPTPSDVERIGRVIAEICHRTVVIPRQPR